MFRYSLYFPFYSQFPSPYRRLLIQPIHIHIYGWLILFGFFFHRRTDVLPRALVVVGSPVGGSRGEWTQQRNKRRRDNGMTDTTVSRGSPAHVPSVTNIGGTGRIL